jgi:hypothetical protein
VIELLAQIEGKNDQGKSFHAGIVLWDDVVIEAAPIVGFMKRKKWTRDLVRDHCQRKGWTISVVWRMER